MTMMMMIVNVISNVLTYETLYAASITPQYVAKSPLFLAKVAFFTSPFESKISNKMTVSELLLYHT